MKQAIVRWSISAASIGTSVVAIGIFIVVMSSVHVQGKPILPFEFVFLGVIVALVGIGLTIYGVAKRGTTWEGTE